MLGAGGGKQSGSALSLNRVVRKSLAFSPCSGTYKPASEKSGAKEKETTPDRSCGDPESFIDSLQPIGIFSSRQQGALECS